MLQQDSAVKTLMSICIDKIVDNYDRFSNDIYGSHLEDQIYFTQHKRCMKKTLDYLDLINRNINKTTNDKKDDHKTIYSIKYLRGEDFFSYDHLLVRYSSGRFTGVTFIQM